MIEDLISIGTGGVDFVRLIEDINSEKKVFNFLGFLEKDESKIGKELLGYPILGTDELLLTQFSNCSVVNNVMNTPRLHSEVTKKLITHYHVIKFPNLIHPSVDMRFVKIGEGNIIYPLSDFGALVEIGNFNIMYGASVAHESVIGDSNCFAQVRVGARCNIGSYNLFGNGSVISNLVKIKDDNTIGVGSVVMANVKSGKHLLGYPAVEANDFVSSKYNQDKKEDVITIDRIINLFKDVLDREEPIQADDEFRDYEEWDSIAYLSVLSTLNDEFGAQISEEDFKKIESIRDVYFFFDK